MKKVFIKTYGCQMNERDSEAVGALLRDRGYALVSSEDDADVILLNTCSVRDLAEQKALGKMGLLGRLKRKRPAVVLGFMGCMAQRAGAELHNRLPELDLVIGTQKFHKVPDYVDHLLRGVRQPITDIEEEAGSENTIRDHLAPGAKPTAFVSIMQGCDMSCSFCIVPATRGHERSRPIADILAEIRELTAQGVKEITLLGQIITSYGRDIIPVRDGQSPFVQLLEAVNAEPGVERIRFTSPHPQGFRDDLIQCFGRLAKLCEYVHLPAQSGSNRILKAMQRSYSVEKYKRIVARLRDRVPDIAISTDLIVGFPGETAEDFEHTLQLVEEVQFDSAFLFKYSRRTGTPAATTPGQIPQAEIERRHQKLLKLMERISLRRNQRLVGRTLEVLVEGEPKARKVEGRMCGRTRCNRLVFFQAGRADRGRLVAVQINRATAHTLYGELTSAG
ncbi:MAG: tRNA (N6-isopentenyl adenosine(37)-C2)-methylthiotransferase MiaB [Verrucomicrobia bacterium]|nr:tRNA (N6-isopentenyl adenosine(37)-C2)-methylthiotransferase MiaB [Verrucomicrobiota bacterium]